MSLAHKRNDYSAPAGVGERDISAQVSTILERGIREGVVGGGIALVARRGQVVAHLSRGARVSSKSEPTGEPIFPDTVFDLGSLTESVCTASLMMRLISVGKLSLDDRASRFVQSLGVGERNRVTLAHLLAHASGYPASLDIYEALLRANSRGRPGILASSGGRHHAYRLLHGVELRSAPGSKRTRSEIDYLLLGEICEIVTGMSLERAFSRYVAAPLNVRSLNFIDLERTRGRNVKPVSERFAPIGECPERARLICGEVWDQNAWAMGGIAGSNGLFGAAEDLLVWAHEIACAIKGRSELIDGEVARSLIEPHVKEISPEWRLGFEAGSARSAGSEGSDSSDIIVAASETGCSVMIEPQEEVLAVLLMSGGFTGGATKRYCALRDEIHAAVLETEVS